eukprot:3645056-Prymnesium_polylepis.1
MSAQGRVRFRGGEGCVGASNVRLSEADAVSWYARWCGLCGDRAVAECCVLVHGACYTRPERGRMDAGEERGARA